MPKSTSIQLMVGFGAIIGLRAGLSLLLGALLAWLGLAPWVLAQGWAKSGPPDLDWFAPLVEWLLWPGVTLMTVSSLASFAQVIWQRRRRALQALQGEIGRLAEIGAAHDSGALAIGLPIPSGAPATLFARRETAGGADAEAVATRPYPSWFGIGQAVPPVTVPPATLSWCIGQGDQALPCQDSRITILEVDSFYSFTNNMFELVELREYNIYTL